MEANGEVSDLVAKSVWLGCVRAKGIGLWKLYTTTGCNQTNHNSNIFPRTRKMQFAIALYHIRNTAFAHRDWLYH